MVGLTSISRLRERPRLAAACALAAIVLVSIVVRAVLSRNVPGPWIFVDELIYSELGRTAYSGFAIRGVPVGGYGTIYPYLLAPSYQAFSNLVDAYAAVKATNAVVMSMTAIPAYFIARTLMNRSWALAVAALAVAVPGMAYTGMVMTESAFYPAFALAILLIILTLQRPTLLRQIAVFAAAGLCYEVRAQGAVVVPALLASVVLFVVLDGVHADPGERLRRVWRGIIAFIPTWIIVAAGTAAVVVVQRSRGASFSSLLGAYSITVEDRGRYQIKPIMTWFVAHIAELDLWLGILPFIALLVLIGVGLTKKSARDERIFACAVIPVILMMTAVVAAFVVFANVSRIEDRNLFYVGFFALTAMGWWASHRFAREQPRWFVLAVALSALLPMTLSFGTLFNQSAVSDTFGIFVPYAINSRLQDSTLTGLIVGLGVLVSILLLLILGDRRGVWLVVGVAAFLLITGIAVDRRTDKAAVGAQAISEPKNWVDESVGSGSDVTVVFPGGSDPMRVWQAEFFNRSIGDVLTITTPLAGGLPDKVVNIRPDGTITDRNDVPESALYVLTNSLTSIVGDVVARDAAYGMVLLRVSGPLRAASTSAGVYGDGWSGADVSYTRYACNGGTVLMEASVNASVHPDPVTVTPYRGDKALPATTVTSTVGSVQVRAALVPEDGLCQIRFHIDPLAIPAQTIGTNDMRELGVIVRGFSYEPAN